MTVRAGTYDPIGGDIAEVERRIAWHERKRAKDIAYIERYTPGEFPDVGVSNSIAEHDRELKKLRAKLARLKKRKGNPTMATKKKAKRKATPAQLRALKKAHAALRKKRAATKRNPAYGNYKKARAVVRGSRKANPAKKSGPDYRGLIIAAFAPKSERVVWWNGKGWGTHASAATYSNVENAAYVARKCKRPCAVASVNMAGADIRAQMLRIK